MAHDDEAAAGAAVQLELFSPDRLQVGEGLQALAELDLDRAAALFADLVARFPEAADARHGLATALRWQEILGHARALEPAAAASLLWRALHVEGEPITTGLRRAMLEKLLQQLEGDGLTLVPPDLCAGAVLLELDRPREAAAALESSARLVIHDPSWLLAHANGFWRLRLASRARAVAAQTLLLAPEEATADRFLDPAVRELVQRHGPLWAPVFGWLAGLMPFRMGDATALWPPSPAASALCLLQAAEDARRSGGYDAMVAARRRLSEEYPELFRAYMARLEGGAR